MKKMNFYYILALTIVAALSCKTNKNTTSRVNDNSEIRIDTVLSLNLNEPRIISVYLPKNYTKKKSYTVIYSTDGQVTVDFYKNDFDSIITNKIVSEFIFVGVHSNENNVTNSDFSYRNYEYIKGWAEKEDVILNARFSDHYNFFSKEVITYIEQKYSVSKTRENRIFYGTSNGAGFGVTLGSENPDLFSNYICFSMAGGNYENLKWTESNQPYYYLAYGEEEPFPLVIAIKEFDKFLTQNNHPHLLYPFKGGHNKNMWKNEFFRVLPNFLKI